jgi:hypothetical protein
MELHEKINSIKAKVLNALESKIDDRTQRRTRNSLNIFEKI